MHGYWAELNELTTNRKLESESVELKMNEKYMRYLWYYPLCQKIRLNWFKYELDRWNIQLGITMQGDANVDENSWYVDKNCMHRRLL